MKMAYTVDDYRERFRNMKVELIAPDEVWQHCIDQKSFEGEFFCPPWAISNYGRVYSLADQRILSLADTDRFGYYRFARSDKWRNQVVNNQIHITVHRLVANYFCDKSIIDKYGEDHIVVHHIRSYTLNKDDPTINKADNLQFLRWEDHDELTKIQQGKRARVYKFFDADGNLVKIKAKTEVDSIMEIILQNNKIKFPDTEIICNDDGTITVRYHFSDDHTYDNATKEDILKDAQELVEYIKTHTPNLVG